MFPSILTPWFKLSCDLSRLAYEAQALVALRLFAMATGGVPMLAEAQRMVPEKVAALSAANAILASGALDAHPEKTAAKVVALYRDRVKANKTRLSKASARISRH